jgi:hypothetical protein
MRLFLTLGMALVVYLGAAFWSGDNLPGREVGAAESGRVVGGQTGCATSVCGAIGKNCNGTCYNPGTSGSACTVTCDVYGACTAG